MTTTTAAAHRETVSCLDRAWAHQTAPRLRQALAEASQVPGRLYRAAGELPADAQALVAGAQRDLIHQLTQARSQGEAAVWAAENVLSVAADLIRDVAVHLDEPGDLQEEMLKLARSLERTAAAVSDWHIDRPRALRLALEEALGPRVPCKRRTRLPLSA